MKKSRIKVGNVARGRAIAPAPSAPDYSVAAAHGGDYTLTWTVTTQPAQFLVEQSNNQSRITDAEEVSGLERAYAPVEAAFARVTPQDADGNALTAPGEWIEFPENE